MLDAIIRTFRPDDTKQLPGILLNYINQHFFTRRERGRFLTANLYHYSPKKRTLLYASAGHPPGFIKRGDEIIRLGEGGICRGGRPSRPW